MDGWAPNHPYRQRIIVSAGMLAVGATLALSTMWVWRVSLFIIGQILNGLGVIIAVFTLFQYINRPQNVMDRQTMPRTRELNFKRYGSQYSQRDR